MGGEIYISQNESGGVINNVEYYTLPEEIVSLYGKSSTRVRWKISMILKSPVIIHKSKIGKYLVTPVEYRNICLAFNTKIEVLLAGKVKKEKIHRRRRKSGRTSQPTYM